MSKRYGRQQKRKAREEINNLKYKVACLNSVVDKNERIVQRTAEILGENFVSLDAAAMDVGFPLPGTLRIPKRRDAEFFGLNTDAKYVDAALDILEFPIMTMRSAKDTLRDCMHFRLQHNDKTVGYTINEFSLREMPRLTVIEIVSEEIAGMLYESIKNPEIVRR